MKSEEIYQYDNSRQEIFFKEAEKSQKQIEEYRKTTIRQNYISICQQTAKLIKSLAGDFQNDAVYMAIFVYLYRNGYLSVNKYFEFAFDDEEIGCNCGLSVITGKGVCRNISSFFKDILIAIHEKKNGIIMVGTNPDEKSDTFIPRMDLPIEFNLNIGKTTSITENAEKYEFLPNHAEVLVFEKETKTYGFALYDPTNIRITEIDYSSRTKERRAIDFRCGIWDINTHLDTLKDREEFITKFGKIAKIIEMSKHDGMHTKALKILLEYARIQCNTNKDKIEDFYNNEKVWYLNIKEQKEIYNNNIKHNKSK